MKYIFNNLYIKGNEKLFWIYSLSMLIIIVIAAILVYKELKNKK